MPTVNRAVAAAAAVINPAIVVMTGMMVPKIIRNGPRAATNPTTISAVVFINGDRFANLSAALPTHSASF